MRFQEAYKKLTQKKYYVFSFEDLCAFYPSEKRANLKQCLARWKKAGWIASLKRGLYELTFPEPYALSDFYIANKIYSPSYVSLETALSHYSMIPEVSMAVTSLTSKPTRRFKNHHGLFIYRSVQPEAFCGYIIEKHNTADVLIAEPEKALVDFLYFNSLHKLKLNFNEERMDTRRIRHLNRKKLNQYASIYKINLKEILYAYL